MASWILAIGLILSFGVTVGLIPLVRHNAIRFGWVDRPDGRRKLHEKDVPVVGGLAILAGFMLGLLFLVTVAEFAVAQFHVPPLEYWIGAVCILAAGMYDDFNGLNVRKKFLVQLLAAYLLLHAGYRFDVEQLLWLDVVPYHAVLYSIPLTMVWIVAVINAVNLIDGLDGLAGGVAIIAFVGMGLLFGTDGAGGFGIMAALLVAALAGFLVHNFYPASIFMGDAGSLFIGYTLAAYSLDRIGSTQDMLSVLALIAILGLPLLDAALAFTRRWVQGKKLFTADHDHIHHRLLKRWSQPKAVFILYIAELMFIAAAVGIYTLGAVGKIGVSIGVGVLLVLGLMALGYFRLPGRTPPEQHHRNWMDLKRYTPLLNGHSREHMVAPSEGERQRESNGDFSRHPDQTIDLSPSGAQFNPSEEKEMTPGN